MNEGIPVSRSVTQTALTLKHDAHLRAVALLPLFRHFQGMDGFSEILAKHGLRLDQLSDPYELVSLLGFLSILEDAALLAKDPVLGARLGLTLSPGDLGPAGLLMMQSATIRQGLTRYAESISALQSATDMHLVETEDQLEFIYQVKIDRPFRWPQDAEISLSSTCHLIRTCFDPNWKPLEVHFQHGYSPRPDLLKKLFQAPVLFGQSTNRLVFSKEKVDQKYRNEDAPLIDVVRRHLSDLILENKQESRCLSDRVREILSIKLGRRSCKLTTVAIELGMTPRTLQRSLHSEGMSFSGILKEHREEVIKAHLECSKLSLAEVAWSLGYSDGTVLWRAYKQWTGTAPSLQRKRSRSKSLETST